MILSPEFRERAHILEQISLHSKKNLITFDEVGFSPMHEIGWDISA